ncbi:Mpo1 family 2-hydroxy fatty acid dioxygenase [Facilibium subflavum]|uniref:Mpo1 family 2-hydroxy fatty acid dioxygenase n=1 Tax=Facilibium subflavum TaxID=2219058 RepID=UPI000E64FA7A|nr:Mpo1-like protein [Facilibium subflavum]
MKTLQSWLDEYAQSHQNQTNKKIHFICVPLIMFSILGITLSISIWITLVLMIISFLFYFRLHIILGIYMLVISFIMLAVLMQIPYLFIVSVIIFIISWVFQFIGHKIEGKKPSFLKDLQFLLIGPLWVLDYTLQKLGWRK